MDENGQLLNNGNKKDMNKALRIYGRLSLQAILIGFLVAGLLAPTVAGSHKSKSEKSSRGKKEKSDKKKNGGPRAIAIGDDESLVVHLVADLRFGRVILSSKMGGNVTIDARTGQKSVGGGIQNGGGYHSRAEYVVKGKPNSAFQILLPKQINLKGKQGTVKIVNLSTMPRKTGKIGANGEARFFLGGMIRFSPTQPDGLYRGRTHRVRVTQL